MKYLLSIVLLALIGVTTPKKTTPAYDWGSVSAKPDLSWADQVGAQRTPKNTEWDAGKFGLRNDTSVFSTPAIQAAIDACHQQGGGTVVVAPGYYKIGALFIKSGVNLHLSKGTTLLASDNIQDYPEFPSRIAGIEMTWPSAVINIMDAENAALTGEGFIDCRGKVFWDKYWAMREEYEKKNLRWIVDYDCKRVRGVLVSNSKHITLKDFTLVRTGFWACQILYSDHCSVSGLTINNNVGGHGPSTDGIDIDSSTNILVENCDVDCNDDNICIKAGRDADGLRLKSSMNRGGTVENIYMTRVEADSVTHILSVDLNWNPKYSYSALPKEYEGKDVPEHWTTMLTPVEPKEKGYPHFRNVYFSHVKADGAKRFISASGWSASHRIENFYLSNINAEVESVGKITYGKNFQLQDIHLTVKDKSRLRQTDNIDSKIEINYK